MPLKEFWHGDLRLLSAYQKAYTRDKSYTAWLNGAFVFEASYKAIINGNRAKKSDPVLQYGVWEDPNERQVFEGKEEREMQFRKQQAEQNAWLHSQIKT